MDSDGGLRKRIIINKDQLEGKSSDIANIYFKLKVYALLGTARTVITSNGIEYSTHEWWPADEKVNMSYKICQWSHSDYAIGGSTDPHELYVTNGQHVETLVSSSLHTPTFRNQTNDKDSTDGWYT